MRKIYIPLIVLITLFFSNSILSQDATKGKAEKTKIEQTTETKVSKSAKELKTIGQNVSEKTSKMKKSCSTNCTKACCSERAGAMKVSNSEKKHGADCNCEGCVTASTNIENSEKMMKKAHEADCNCEGCKMADVKSAKSHKENCSCQACKA